MSLSEEDLMDLRIALEALIDKQGERLSHPGVHVATSDGLREQARSVKRRRERLLQRLGGRL